MSDTVHIKLSPMGAEFDIPKDTSLQDVLFSYGVEFPCGGRGRCKGCRVRVVEGQLPITKEQENKLTQEELKAGWRLSCQCRAETDLELELAQWSAEILSDDATFEFEPQEGLGIAIDVGTTTIVAQLLDLSDAKVYAVRTALNPQARYGADIMSRVSYAVEDNGKNRLVRLIRKQTGKMVRELLEAAGAKDCDLKKVILVGNTVMHHLFGDLDLEPLSHYPFESNNLGLQKFTTESLNWDLVSEPEILFLPCIGGFVGSDILAGVMIQRMQESEKLVALVDLGTNGEIVIGSKDHLISCSTAAGPAFEGARISMGMRASTGAISEVHVEGGHQTCKVLGNISPKGICGSGLVDAVATALDLEKIKTTGRFSDGTHVMELCGPVSLTQTDIRELQLAKGAIAAGIHILLKSLGKSFDDIDTVYLAGAFGNYITIASACRIGLLKFHSDKIEPSGNTALRGAKLALFLPEDSFGKLADGIEHISLSEKPDFQDVYVDEMSFPAQVEHTETIEKNN